MLQKQARGVGACHVVYANRRLQPADYDGLHRAMAHATTHEMVVVLAGCYASTADGRLLEAGPGDVVYYQPREVHAPRRAGTGDLLLVSLSWIEPRPPERPRPRLVYDRRGRMRTLAQWMADMFPPRDAADAQALNAMLGLLLLAHAQEGEPRVPSLKDAVRAYVHAHLAEPFQLSDLARHAGMSPFHFSRQFRRQADTSPMAYVRRLRVAVAEQMLLQTDATLADIATAVGLGDPSHFSRVFRQVMGQPASVLRRERH